ncbi:unnamed protein product [Ceratitis capitata]|uniref:(Mediterranean fruit fly) hypothetical protein n=1 Tax=Ceratitis capitata TaxID=7213 RepID=A0A811US81_CERCA|nr:unnamed protein product [Ceratitis capitata]
MECVSAVMPAEVDAAHWCLLAICLLKQELADPYSTGQRTHRSPHGWCSCQSTSENDTSQIRSCIRLRSCSDVLWSDTRNRLCGGLGPAGQPSHGTDVEESFLAHAAEIICRTRDGFDASRFAG